MNTYYLKQIELPKENIIMTGKLNLYINLLKNAF